MNAVGDDIERDTVLHQAPAGHAKLAMMHTRHRIEKVRQMPRACLKRPFQRLGICPRMPDRHYPAVRHQLLDQLDPTIDLGRESRHMYARIKLW